MYIYIYIYIYIYTFIHLFIYIYTSVEKCKGGTVVIVDVDDYIQEANRQLDNKKFYKKFTVDTTEINQRKVNRTINKLKSSQLLDEKISNDFRSKN